VKHLTFFSTIRPRRKQRLSNFKRFHQSR